MKANKYNYLLVIQQNTGQGWEDVSEYKANSKGKCLELHELTEISKKTGFPITRKISLCLNDAKEYRLMGYPTRVIFRKVQAVSNPINATM